MIFGRQRLSLILCMSIAATVLSVSQGLCNSEEYTDKAQDIQEELAAKKSAHDALLQKSTALNSQVSLLKKNLVKVSKDLQSSEDNLSATDQRLQDLRQEKEIITRNLYKDQQAMGGLVSAVKKYSQTSTPDMLMKSDPIDAERASMVMKSIMPRLQQQSTSLKSQLAEIKKIENDINNQKNIQSEEADKLDRQQDDLAVLLEQRQKMYQRTESQRVVQEKEVAALTQKSKNIEDLIQRLKQNSKRHGNDGGDMAENADLPSHMLLPVRGKIYTAFGQRDSLGAPSKGVTFSTRSGASVVTPLAGIVKFAGPFQKYKQILIVEHKGGYHSLIAGLARIDTVVGASLAAGEPVGVAETSGSPRVYYELRYNGKPVNPQRSLLAQRKQEKS
jgi:septal ring factor EnvC (AmiA/AmiB activator)